MSEWNVVLLENGVPCVCATLWALATPAARLALPMPVLVDIELKCTRWSQAVTSALALPPEVVVLNLAPKCSVLWPWRLTEARKAFLQFDTVRRAIWHLPRGAGVRWLHVASVRVALWLAWCIVSCLQHLRSGRWQQQS